MKIAVFGTTLHAGVMAALLAEYGNQIYWCTSVTCEENISVLSYQDQEVNHYLNKQRKAGFLTESPFLKSHWMLKFIYFVLAQHK